ncbi:hypothetical protein ACS3SW_17835 [Roseobacteraceae bacterium S113]
MADPLRLAAAHAKWVLVAGLVMAVLLPGLAQVLAGWLVPLIVLIMFVGALRLAPERVAGLWARPGQALGQVAAMQLGLPLAVMALLWMLGAGGSVWGAALVLVLSAPAIVSSPNIAAILGLDTLSAMRAVCWGTVLVPLTCLPALMFLFGGRIWARFCLRQHGWPRSFYAPEARAYWCGALSSRGSARGGRSGSMGSRPLHWLFS